MMMPRPSFVTSSGPSPVRGFMAAISVPFLQSYRDGGGVNTHRQTWKGLLIEPLSTTCTSYDTTAIPVIAKGDFPGHANA